MEKQTHPVITGSLSIRSPRQERVRRYAQSARGKAVYARANRKYYLKKRARIAAENAARIAAGNLTPEELIIRDERLSIGLPWPVPENEYRDQEAQRLADFFGLKGPDQV